MPSTPDPPNAHEPNGGAPLPPGLVEQAALAANVNNEGEGTLSERENDQNEEPEGTKPEGSGYDSSYRSSDTRAGINRVYGFSRNHNCAYVYILQSQV